MLPSFPVSLNFEQNLEQNYLAEASQQLLAREACLFIIDDQGSESTDEQRVRTEEEEMILKKDYETLSMRIWLAVSNSFDRRNQYALESAVTAILQEEEQDQHWKEAGEKECPSWRPMGYQDMHDIVIQSMVKKRIQQVDEEEQAEDKLKKEISQMNMLIQDDMLQVVRDVQACYPPEFGICNMYAQLYHQAFSTKLRQLPRYNIPIEECIFILKQISNYSNKVLHQEELESYISSEALEPLLPAEDLKSLEEQYLSHKENEVKTWLFNILRLEEESWKTNTKPELNDGYFCSFAQDVIYVTGDRIHVGLMYHTELLTSHLQLVDGAMKEATNLLSNRNKAQRILYLLPSFLESYKKSMEDLLRNQENITEILKAHLFGIKNLREYIADRDNLPDDMKTEWLSTAADIRDSCHKYFLSPIHDVLKVNYSKLWTPDWFSEHHEFIEELEDKLNKLMHPLKDLDSVCLQELLSQLHFEVMIEYVRRMLKRKLKLKNKDEQETAAAMLCEDSDRINTLFIENGSDKTWLCEILPKVAEVLKVQDSDTLELEICALLKNYPDLTERQIRSILQLKTNISCADNRMIKECYQQSKSNIPDSEPAQLFFCRVPHSFSFNLYSCFCMWPPFKGTVPCKNGCQASSPV
ncbi:hypothetical protein NFI96_026976 [Prochilodus magdalenae]|nr:hypothetical protein NFI96_026976 [Prochilodus magdalenae]